MILEYPLRVREAMIQEDAKKAIHDNEIGTFDRASDQKNDVELNANDLSHHEQVLGVFDFLCAQRFRVKVPKSLVPNLKETPSG